MNFDLFSWIGLSAGAITSVGFIPQLIRGLKTKSLNDVSYWMPIVLAIGLFLWLIYGILRNDFAIIVTNSIGVTCNIILLIMKKWYS